MQISIGNKVAIVEGSFYGGTGIGDKLLRQEGLYGRNNGLVASFIDHKTHTPKQLKTALLCAHVLAQKDPQTGYTLRDWWDWHNFPHTLHQEWKKLGEPNLPDVNLSLKMLKRYQDSFPK